MNIYAVLAIAALTVLLVAAANIGIPRSDRAYPPQELTWRIYKRKHQQTTYISCMDITLRHIVTDPHLTGGIFVGTTS
jgi:hypothetical protein